MRLAKIGDRPKIRLIAGGEHPESHVFDQPTLNLPRRKDADAVRVHQTFVSMTK
jgi:hypothetical protein